MLKNGTFLQNRYEIIARIGSGGMADVYKAKDHKLNRFVAVKVLKAEFRDDTAFLSKFRVEAQAAAGLAHANIVNVYDVGEDRGASFIVMELVEGITLKDYIAKKGRLSAREATSIALQASAGLEAAHNNGIIHRDVKPQNIIISVDGKAKITDFGIARAASSDTITQSAMGSVHYCAPEQTRGGYCDAKSDIYAMGVTIFEMLTGRLPFDGESTVEIALKHLQEEFPSPCRYVPDIPRSIEQIVMRCTQKSPDRRYANMAELIRDLRESLVDPDGDFVVIPTVDRKAQTVKLSREEVSQIKNGSLPSYDRTLDTGAAAMGTQQTPSSDSRMYPYGSNYYQNSGYQSVGKGDDGPRDLPPDEPPYDLPDDEKDFPDDEDEQRKEDERRRQREKRKRKKPGDDGGIGEGAERVITIIGIVAAVLVILLILFFIGRALGMIGGAGSGTPSTEAPSLMASNTVEVPDLTGKSEGDAQQLLRDLGLNYQYQGESPSNQLSRGLVVGQSVASTSVVEKGTTVGYVLSSGSSQTLTVPELSGSSQSDAEKALVSMGLLVSVDNSRYSETVEEGKIITTNPGAGSTVNPGDTVTLYISQGQGLSMVQVPELTGHNFAVAQQALNNIGLYVYITEVPSDTVAEGVVISQDVEAGSSVQTGTTVTITVSSGPENAAPEGSADPEEVWMCYAQLDAPEGYAGEPVRIVLAQGDEMTTLFEGDTTFPYLLNVQGKAGVSTGTVYVYTLDASSWEVTSTTEYAGVAFDKVE